MKSWRDTLPTLTKHGLMVTLDHTCGITTDTVAQGRTTLLEGWHNHMKRISRKTHPNLYEVLELFQREQAAPEVIILQVATMYISLIGTHLDHMNN